MKKRFLTALLAAVMLLTACSGDEVVDQNEKTSKSSKKDNSSDLVQTDSENSDPEPAKELGIWDIIPEIEVTDVSAFDYEYNSSLGGIVITGYLDKSPKVRIPDIIEGEPVVGVRLGNYEKELIQIVLPDTVKEFSFSESVQRSLKYMNVPGAAQSFDYSARSELSWSELIGIYISDGITEIDEEVFVPCTSLEKIKVDPQNPEYCSVDGILFTKDKTELIAYPAGKSNTSYTIPGGVTEIGNGAFAYCTNLENVTIPDGVTKIGDSTFVNCTNLKSVTIPNGITTIRTGTFRRCTSLTSMIIPDGVTEIFYVAFEGCANLKSVTIPDSVMGIGFDAFNGCTNLVVSYKGKIYDYAHIEDLIYGAVSYS